MLEFLAIEPQPHQPDPKGKQLIVAVGLVHDRAALGDSLGGDGKAQIHIGGNFSRMECGIETAPFHRPPVKDRMQIQCVIAGPVIMVCAAVISLIPDILQLRQIPCLIRREPAGLLQHGFPHLLTPTGRPAFIDLQRFEQDILLGVHDADEVFQTLPVMIGCVHMDMDIM